MFGRSLSRILQIVRGTTLAIGLAIIPVVVLGAATTPLAAAPGDPLRLGKANPINKLTKLVGKGAVPRLVIDNNGNGVALTLQVNPGKAPMQVNSDAKVNKLDADVVDGKGANEIGVNGMLRSYASSPYNSASPKNAVANCPVGKVVVGTGYAIIDGKSGTPANQQTDVVIDQIGSTSTSVTVAGIEETPTSAGWRVNAVATCATAP